MPLQFPCPNCGQIIALRFLNVGETAQCKLCGQAVVVPKSAIVIGEPEYSAMIAELVQADDSRTMSGIGTPAPAPALMPHSARAVRGLMFFSAAFLFVINIYLWTGRSTIEIQGMYVCYVGQQKFMIAPPKGWIIDSDPATLRALDEEAASFVAYGDSLHEDYPLVFAEPQQMGEFTDLESLRDFLLEDTTATVIVDRIKNGKLEIIYTLNGDGLEGMYFYSRHIPAYPFYLNINSVYQDGPEPPEYLMNLIRNIRNK